MGFHFADADHFPEENLQRVGNKVSEPGDVVFTSKGTVGRFGFVRPDTPRFVYSPQLCFWRSVDRDLIDPRFLYYWMFGREFFQQFKSVAGQTDMAEYVSLTDQRRMHITLPARKEQRAIAHILGTMDNKIEMNRRMNETLEAMAQALFKSWFVDFDPVHAKADGRDPGLPKPLADLFPDSFEDSELGEIPKGWEVKPFAAIVEIIGGGTPKTSVPEYWDGEIPWFSVVDAPNGADVWVVDTEKKITREGVENSSTRILPVGTTIISARGTVGRIALVGVPMAMNQSCYGLQGKEDRCGFFTYFATRELVASLRQHAHGSVFDTITRDTLAGVSVAVPSAELIEAFETRVGPSMERIRAGLFESRTLSALRDTLLPKLISGELRVRDADKIVEATT
ncbi:MAG: restriction endonuclease subunit S [Chloroflexi bacterium]|nr:restriction endonuclease subunit S [Chloroflexota bacterium]